MTKWVNPVTTTNDADIKLVHTDNTDVIANACKKIAELEKENEQLRNNGFTVSAMTEQQLKEAIEKGEQLEKENAELKKKIGIYQKGMYDEIEKRDKKLTKANSLLADVYKIAMSDWNDPKWHDQVLRNAREYLKEIEK